MACVVEVEQAAKEGREFTPIYWYYPEGGAPVLTLWDMNETKKEWWNNPYIFNPNKTL
jgi:hypothetical protein